MSWIHEIRRELRKKIRLLLYHCRNRIFKRGAGFNQPEMDQNVQAPGI